MGHAGKRMPFYAGMAQVIAHADGRTDLFTLQHTWKAYTYVFYGHQLPPEGIVEHGTNSKMLLGPFVEGTAAEDRNAPSQPPSHANTAAVR